MTVLANIFSNLGLQPFGLGMPRIAWHLWPVNLGVTLARDDQNAPPLTLTARVANVGTPATWIAPLPGATREVLQGPTGVDLRRADGQLEAGPGLLLMVHPQAYSRLARLYAELLEAPPNPRGIPTRPVPKYFFYGFFPNPDPAVNATKDLSGGVNTGDELGFFEQLRCYDAEGHAIDPLAVLSAFTILGHLFPPLMWMPGVVYGVPVQGGLDVVLTTGFQMSPSDIPPNPGDVRIRLTRPDGTAHDGTGLTGLTAINAANGLFLLPPGTAVGRAPGASANLVFGPTQAGTLGAAFAPPAPGLGAVAGSVTPLPAMTRDFYTLRVVDLDDFLLGPPEIGFADPNGTGTLEQRPVVRTGQTVTPLIGGNAVATAAAAVVASPAGQQQCLAETIDPAFVPPAATFPATPPAAPIGPTALPVNLRQGPSAITATAMYVGAPAPPTVDVLLTLAGLPAGTAVRVYPRTFDEEAREGRGDGVGALVGAGPTALLLPDALALVHPSGKTDAVPPLGTLRFDLALVSDQPGPNGAPVARIYGNLSATLNAAGPFAAPPPAPPAASPFLGGAVLAGTSNSRIAGLEPTPPGGPGDFFSELFGVEVAVNPREATRFPTMACRDLVVSDRSTAVIAGGRLAPELWSSQTRIGAPGSAGGREVQAVGVGVGGQLAYDLAVNALRRTQFLPLGLITLAGGIWDAPGAPPPAPGATFAGAVLQNTAPVAEMPNLRYLAGAEIQNHAIARPNYTNPATNFNVLVNWIAGNLENQTIPLPGGQQFGPVDDLANLLRTMESSLESDPVFSSLPPAVQNLRRQRLFLELERRMVTAIYGRHDSERTLLAAFARARRLVFVETPGLGFTSLSFAGDPQMVQPAADNLWTVLAQRMAAVPTLRALICIPRDTDYPPGFAEHIAYEKKERSFALAQLPPERVRVFHPIGFPGRPSRLATTTVVVDDAWALVGSSSLRRRGLRFDASSDLVFTDLSYETGRCPALAELRRQTLAARLGLPPADGGVPHPGFVRLFDLEEAFEVVSEALADGGYGRVEPFVPEPLPIFLEQTLARKYNPDGAEVAEDLPLWAELFTAEFLSS